MKRIQTILTVLVLMLAFAVSASAQTEPHLKFMGIPIDGTISGFRSKLAAKGFRYDTKLNKDLDGAGFRYFRGMYAGYKVTLEVCFNTDTEVVYDVKVMTGKCGRKATRRVYGRWRSKLLAKYQDEGLCEDTKMNDEDCTKVWVFQDGNPVGLIGLYICMDVYSKTWVTLEFIDMKNSEYSERFRRGLGL